MQYTIFLKGPAQVVEVGVETDEKLQFGLSGSDASFVKAGDFLFRRGDLIAIMPTEAVKRRVTLKAG